MDLSTLIACCLGGRGDQIALESGARTWSYAELDRITRERAALLRRSAPDAVTVALAGEHTAEAVMWALAVMRAGLVYTPFSTGLSTERMREALDLAAPGLVLCCSAAVATALRKEDIGAEVLTADELANAATGESGEPPGSWPARQVAYSILTSGSSGRPKLVNVGHRGIENLCRAQARLFGLDRGQRVLQFSSLAFDASIAELLVTLFAGATLVVPEWDGGSWVNAVARRLRDGGCDLITLPPSVYARLDEGARRRIRTIVFAGEALSEVEFRAAIRHSRVLNAYGPTEGTVCFSVAELTRFTTSIGRPIDGYTARVHNPERGTYGEAGRGELVLVGDGVALGYEGRSAEPDGPFRTVDDRPAYHTGDDVELRDGEVFYLGRLDDQIKRLGHRISLAALEGGLSRLLDSRVAVLTDGSSLVLAHTAADWPEPELRRRLREVLPAWEVPDVLLVVPDIPVTGTGKVDKDSLRASVREGNRSAVAGATPALGGELEIVRGIVENTIGNDIDLTTSVYDAGGNSFTLVQIQVDLAARFGEETVLDAFDQLNYDFTVAGFVNALRGRPPETGSPAQAVFRTVSSDLANFPAELRAIRSARPAHTTRSGAVTVTVTGASGFIGGHVLDRLLGSGRPITVVTMSSPDRLVESHRARFHRQAADLADVRFLGYDDLDDAAGDPDPWGAVVHCGFEVNHVLPLERQLRTSVASTRALLRAAASRGAHRFVFLSAASVGDRFRPFTADSLAAVGDSYSQAKFVAEAYAAALDGDACRVDLIRLGLVYGHSPREVAFLDRDVFASLLRLSARHGMLPRLSGQVPICHVTEVVDAALAAAAAGGADGERSVLVQRTYGLDALLDEFGLSEEHVVDPRDWLTTVTEAGSADARILAALRLWLDEPGWGESVRTTDRPIIEELRLAMGS